MIMVSMCAGSWSDHDHRLGNYKLEFLEEGTKGSLCSLFKLFSNIHQLMADIFMIDTVTQIRVVIQ